MPPKDKPPSLAAVAASAGVSIATVSKVVNGRSDVGPETRARVQSLLDQHDYVARRTDPGRAAPGVERTVELVFHGKMTGYALTVLEGVLAAGSESGATISVTVRPHRPTPGVQSSSAWVRQLVQRGRAAVIDVVDDVRHGDATAIAKSRLPLVVVDPLSMPRRDVTSVGGTNFSGGLAATQHLLALGHVRIAYLGAPADFVFNQARMHGFRAALEGAGLSVPDGYIETSPHYDYDDGVLGGGALLDLPERPTAIFAVTDECAAGVIEAARSRGLRVPEDLSIVGFDDAPVARLLSPPLTTVRQPLRDMGRVALRTALRLAAGERLDSHHVELATELIVRSSTAAPSDSSDTDRG